jgi:hypothetical protein
MKIKKFAAFGVALVVVALGVWACQKNTDNFPLKKKDALSSQFEQVTTSEFSPAIYFDIGTYLIQGCVGSSPCGPCAGICVRNGKNPRKRPRHSIDLSAGERKGTGTLLSDSLFQMEFTLNEDIEYQGNVHVEGDMFFDDSLAIVYQKSSIKLLQGVYPITTLANNRAKVIFSVISQ